MLLLVGLAACGGSSSGPQPSSHGRTYDLSKLPIAAWTAGLPASGHVTVTSGLPVELDHLDRVKDWEKVAATIDAACSDCRIGDDHTELEIGDGRTAFGGPLAFSHLAWDTATLHADIKDGAVHVISHLRGDVDIDYELRVTLSPSLPDSPIDGCLAFRPSERLRARDEKLYDLALLTGAPKGADGRYYISLRGLYGQQRRLAGICDVAAK
jgi:hypothetical protein